MERLALDYAGRYATSRAKLADYLRRKVRERGWAGDDPPPIEAIVERFATLGYVDDRAMAESKARSLASRGYGPRRVAQALGALGIAGADGEEARRQARAAEWETALAFARRRRIGPYAREVPDEAARRRAFAAMMRAGHGSETTRRLLDLEPGVVPEWDDCGEF